jgi:UDP-N-acetylglucosamine transferase subunit ALG13
VAGVGKEVQECGICRDAVVIFLTVGTYPLQFDRLVKGADIAVRDGLIEEEMFAQIGSCNYRPRHIDYAEMLVKSEFDDYFQRATSIVGHAGMGTISMALEENKPIVVMARMSKYKEHVNDHQVSTADMFEKLGHVLVAHTADELPKKISELRDFIPAQREATPQGVADRIAEYLRSVVME